MRAAWMGVGLLLPVWAAAAVGGDAPHRWQAGLAFSFRQFHYEETVNGAVLDRESGALPGFNADLRYTRGAWFARGRIGYFAGGVDYDGQTQGGVPVLSRTDEAIFDGALVGGHRWSDLGRWSAAAYGGFGYRHWERDIRSTPVASGIFETYRWAYALLGTTLGYRFGPRTRVALDAGLTRTIGAQVAADFGGVFDAVTLEPADRFGGRLGLRFAYRWAPGWTVRGGPFVRWWVLGRSPARALTQQGSPVTSVFEPASITRSVGFEAGVVHRF